MEWIGCFRCEKFVPRSRIRIFCNDRTRSTQLDPELMFYCVSYHLGAFGTIWLHYKTGAKRAELVQKFVPRNRVGIFCNEHTRSTLLDSKLIFWCVLYYLGAFGTVWVPYKTPCKTGRSGAKVRAMKSFRIFCNECTRSTLLALTSCFSAFRTIWVHLG